MKPVMLKHLTGKDEVWWFKRVQYQIVRSAIGPKRKGHQPNTLDWLDAIKGDIVKYAFKGGVYDGNMRMAVLMGLILTGWYARLHRAKIHDPRRPLKIRQKAYEAWLQLAQESIFIWVDESRDGERFPEQPWNSPFMKGAKSGKFV